MLRSMGIEERTEAAISLGGLVGSGENVAKGTGPLGGRYRLMDGGEVDEDEDEEDEAAAPIFVVEVVLEFVRCFLD